MIEQENRDPTGTTLADVLEIGWLLLAVLIPLWVMVGAQRPFELPKVVLLRTLIWIMAGGVLAQALVQTATWQQVVRRQWRHNLMVGPVLALGMVLMLASVTAVDPPLSWWGSYERLQGTLTHLSYLLLFLIVSTYLRTSAQARRLIVAAAITGIPLITLGLAQALGWNPLGLVTDARSPVYATLGRANFLGAYLVLLLPLTGALALTARQRWQQGLWGILLLAEMGMIGLTLTRSAWLGASVAVGCFILLWWGRRWPRKWRWLGWSGVGIAAISGPLLVGGMGLAQGGSMAARLYIWRGVWQLISQRPFLGHGPDTVGLIFPSVYPPPLVYFQGRAFFVDRAHNLLLDWAVSVGLLGLVAFLVVLGTFIFTAFKAWHRPADRQTRAFVAAATAAVAGGVTNNLLSFEVTATATLTWLLLAMAAALALPTSAPLIEPTTRSWWRWGLAGLLVIGGSVAAVGINGRLLAADIALHRGTLQAQAGHWQAAVAAGEQARRYWPDEPIYHRTLSGWYEQQAYTLSDSTAWLEQAEAALQQARDLRPRDVTTWLALGDYYRRVNQHTGQPTLSLAHIAYQQVVALAPYQSTGYTAWGHLYLQEGHPDLALPLLQKAITLDATDGRAHSCLGDATLVMGQPEVALAHYREAVHWQPELSQAHAGLAQSYWLLGQWQEAALAVEQALRRDPHNELALALQQQIQRHE